MVVLEVEQVLDLPEVHEALEVVEGVVGRAAAFGIVPRRIAVPDAPRELVLELQRAAEAPQVLLERVIERVLRRVQPDDGPGASLHRPVWKSNLARPTEARRWCSDCLISTQ